MYWGSLKRVLTNRTFVSNILLYVSFYEATVGSVVLCKQNDRRVNLTSTQFLNTRQHFHFKLNCWLDLREDVISPQSIDCNPSTRYNQRTACAYLWQLWIQLQVKNTLSKQFKVAALVRSHDFTRP